MKNRNVFDPLTLKNSDLGLGDKTDQDQETPKTLIIQNLFVYVQ
jgi:hypothetical protein